MADVIRGLGYRHLLLLGMMAVGLAALAFGLYELRRTFIQAFFVFGELNLPSAKKAGPSEGPLRPVRILLVDGLSAERSRGMPAHDALCRAGLELELDMGFPTVSLPVQHVLWTGVWQVHSGVQFIVGPLGRPSLPSLPALVTERGGRALALAESHGEIARSFPFVTVEAPTEVKGVMEPERLRQRARELALSTAELVFVHFLGVDEAGHHQGGARSEGYRAEAERADQLLGDLLSARRPGDTLCALSDHGHLSDGGHGGNEPEVRRVRACIAGPGIPSGQRVRANLPDLTRLLARQLGVGEGPAHGEGRPPSEVLAGASPPEPPWPRPGRVPLLFAALVLALGLGLAVALVRRQRPLRLALIWLALPWGLLLGLGLVSLWHGPPSLSRGYVFRSMPWAIAPALVPAVLLPVAQLLWAGRRFPVALVAAIQAIGILLGALVPLVLCGYPFSRPPLVPGLTALSSLLLLLGALSLLSLAMGALLRVVIEGVSQAVNHDPGR